MSTTNQNELPTTQLEKKEIAKRTAIGPVIVHEAIKQEGEEELARHPFALMWSGLAAGLSIGLSFLATALIYSYLPRDVSWTPLLYSAGYSVGFIVIILGRQQLFTENTLTAVLPLIHQPKLSTFLKFLKLWSIVLAANLAGTIMFALVIGHIEVVAPNVTQAMLHISESMVTSDFWTMMVKGMFAGWLIALMVWLLPGADTARVWIIFLITYLIGLAGFPHIIAGSTEAVYAIVRGTASVASYFQFMFPTLMGNILGGVILVALLNHLQVVTGRQKE